MKIVATIEARMNSSRLPGKVLLPAAGIPLLQHLIRRLQKVDSLDEIVVATTTNDTDDVLEQLAKTLKVRCFRGSEEDVLGRVLGAVESVKGEIIVELHGDSPLIDPEVVQQGIDLYLQGGIDYVSNLFPQTYPMGVETQVFSCAVLQEVERVTHDDPAAREHVSLPIYEQPSKYRLANFSATPENTWPDLALTLDTPQDYELIRTIIEELSPTNPNLSIGEIIKLMRRRPELVKINSHIRRKSPR